MISSSKQSLTRQWSLHVFGQRVYSVNQMSQLYIHLALRKIQLSCMNNLFKMAELIVDQHNIETLCTSDHINEIKDQRIFSEKFRIKVSQCIKIANKIRTDVRRFEFI